MLHCAVLVVLATVTFSQVLHAPNCSSLGSFALKSYLRQDVLTQADRIINPRKIGGIVASAPLKYNCNFEGYAAAILLAPGRNASHVAGFRILPLMHKTNNSWTSALAFREWKPILKKIDIKSFGCNYNHDKDGHVHLCLFEKQ